MKILYYFVSTFLFVIIMAGCMGNNQEESVNETADNSIDSVQNESDSTQQTVDISSEGEMLSGSVLRDRLDMLPDEEREKILSGGPPPDGIPSLDEPTFTTISEADPWLEPQEPVIIVQIGDEARAYPMQILMWHEIVNDEFAGVPVTVTYCPLCNSSFSFDRRFGDHVLDFGTTGYLYGGALLMYDRQSHTIWAHFGGRGLAGPLADQRLDIIPSSIISWAQFKEEHPESAVLSKDTGFSRSYGNNPYAGYDDVNKPPFLFAGEIDDTFAPKERIVALEYEEVTKAYLLDDLRESGFLEDELAGRPIVLFYQEGTASGLEDSRVAGGRDVGSTYVYFTDNISDDSSSDRLLFEMEGEVIRDQQTGSTWNFFGQAVDGSLTGKKLEPVAFKVDTFWFAWSTYEPNTEIFRR